MALHIRQKIEPWVLRQWQSHGLWTWLTRPLSSVFAVVLCMRRWCYQNGLQPVKRLPAKVVVVGNVVAGGTGKTPVVIAMVNQLSALGWQVGVLARGYRANPSSPVTEVQPDSSAQEVGDEPLLIKQRTQVPVFVARQRADAGQALLQAYPQVQVLVCDDGLQHLTLARDIEMGVFDDRGIGNGLLQPAGPLREPWPRPLDFILHTGQHPHPPGLNALPLVRAQRTLSKQAHAVVGQAQPRALSHWSHSPVAAVAGIAQPEVFFQALRAQGLQVARCHVRPDHHDFLEVLNPDNELRQETLPLFCTEKDAVKLRSLLMRAPLERQPDLWAVPLALDIDAQFWKALEARLKDLSISP